MKCKTALFLMVANPLAACATVPTASEDAATINALSLKPMKEQEIRRRVIGTYSAPYTQYSERYGPDGRFDADLHRIFRSGTFRVKDSELCTTDERTGASEECRTVYKSPSGAIYIKMLGRGHALVEMDFK